MIIFHFPRCSHIHPVTPKSPKRQTTNKLRAAFTATLIRSELLQPLLQFISFALLPHFSSFVSTVQHAGACSPPLPVRWRRLLRDWGSLHAVSTAWPYILMVFGESSNHPGKHTRAHNTVSFVASQPLQAHLFNSDLKREVSAWVEVLIIQFSPQWI